jgi:hypothetical protein
MSEPYTTAPTTGPVSRPSLAKFFRALRASLPVNTSIFTLSLLLTAFAQFTFAETERIDHGSFEFFSLFGPYGT